MKKDFSALTFEDFREMAANPSLSRHEKVGFPDDYREGKEVHIFNDVVRKLPSLTRADGTFLEIGPGCSELPRMLIRHCARSNGRLLLVDSAEMLAHLPDGPGIAKYPGVFPDALGADLVELTGRVDTIIAYSVVQYVFGRFWIVFCRCSLRAARRFLGTSPTSR